MMAAIAATSLALGVFGTPHYGLVPKDHDANLSFRREMLAMAGDDASAAVQIRKMCSEDPLFYINTFCWTYSPKDSKSGYPLTPFNTYGFQDDAITDILNCINTGNDAATPKSRDMGASWMGLTVLEWCWHFRDYLSFLMVSRKQDLVDSAGDPGSLFWKIDFLHKHQPRWLLPRDRWLAGKDPNRKQLHLANAENGSVIDGESTTGNLGVGDRRTAMFIDEFGAFGVDDGYAVLRGTRDVTNCRIFNSTPRGQNAFYEVVTKTAAHVIWMHWSRHPLKCQGLYESGNNGEIKFHDDFRGLVKLQGKGEEKSRVVMFPDDYAFVCDGKIRSPWYDLQCNRCVNAAEIAQELDLDFLGSDYQFFDPESIEILRLKHCRPPDLVGELEFDPETFTPKRFVENAKGRLGLWLPLDSQCRIAGDRRFVTGSDVSAGTGASNSVTSIFDADSGEKVGVWRDSNTRPTLFAKVSVALAKFFNNAFMVWDASGPTGEVFTKRVIDAGFGNIYFRRNEKRIDRAISSEPGFYLNPQAKLSLLEDYREALASGRVINRSETGMKECLQFIRRTGDTVEHAGATNSQDPSGARTAHGDEVIADALATLGVGECYQKKDADQPEIPEGCLAWRMRQKQLQLAAAVADNLGGGW